jgi:hypothetical protein
MLSSHNCLLYGLPPTIYWQFWSQIECGIIRSSTKCAQVSPSTFTLTAQICSILMMVLYFPCFYLSYCMSQTKEYSPWKESPFYSILPSTLLPKTFSGAFTLHKPVRMFFIKASVRGAKYMKLNLES